MSAFFYQTTASASSLLSVGPNAPIKMACVALGCTHETCSGVPLAAMRGPLTSSARTVHRLPEVQMRCVATGCTHAGCVATRQWTLLAPAEAMVAPGATEGGVIELPGAVQMACVALNCSHPSCSDTGRAASAVVSAATTQISADPLACAISQTKSKMGSGLARRNAITARSPRLDVDAQRLSETKGPMSPLTRLMVQLSPLSVAPA